MGDEADSLLSESVSGFGRSVRFTLFSVSSGRSFLFFLGVFLPPFIPV